MAINHQSPAFSLPSFRMKQVNTTTWGAGGNSKTVTDNYCGANSVPYVYVTGSSAQAAGRWSYTVSEGSFTITSSSAESSGLTIAYILL